MKYLNNRNIGTYDREEKELEIDFEWLNLIVEAKRIGIEINEIREFFAHGEGCSHVWKTQG